MRPARPTFGVRDEGRRFRFSFTPFFYILLLVSGIKFSGLNGYGRSYIYSKKVVPLIERVPKRQRQQQLVREIEENPFITDVELTRKLKVSIQTIRLDRLELGIPELRERLKLMAERTYDPVQSLPLHEVIGDVVDLQLDKSGISIFEIREEHVFSRNQIARGHFVFAQANSLAVAVINDEVALTASADIRFVRPVHLGEKCIAKAYVKASSGSKGKAKVEVFTYVADELVFQGHFLIYRSSKELAAEGGNG